MTGIILMIAGSILLVSGFIIFRQPAKADQQLNIQAEIDRMTDLIIADGVLTKNERERVMKFAKEKSLHYEEIINDIEQKLILSGIEAETEIIDYSKKMGDEFEKYIVQKFDKKHFRIKEWAGDKYVNGQYAETTLHPDIVFECERNGRSASFAVECKWRKKSYKDEIEFSYPDQLERYRKFEREKKIPVFVAMGLGGKSSDPEHLYIVPLKKITSTNLSLDFLTPYEKDRAKNFYFVPERDELR
jgi:hypothetical protein